MRSSLLHVHCLVKLTPTLQLLFEPQYDGAKRRYCSNLLEKSVLFSISSFRSCAVRGHYFAGNFCVYSMINRGTFDMPSILTISDKGFFLGYVYPLPDFSSNRSGMDFPFSPVILPAGTPYTACQLLCQNEPKCAAWIYNPSGSYCVLLL